MVLQLPNVYIAGMQCLSGCKAFVRTYTLLCIGLKLFAPVIQNNLTNICHDEHDLKD